MPCEQSALLHLETVACSARKSDIYFSHIVVAGIAQRLLRQHLTLFREMTRERETERQRDREKGADP